MRFAPIALISLLAISTASNAAAVKHKRPAAASPHATKASFTKTTSHSAKASSHSRSSRKHTAKWSAPHQRAIGDDRATEIQTALIKAGYLSGEPSGHWDSQSQAAMQKLQGDNGWQTKLVPDSRALIKLGLGPSTDASAGTPPLASAPAQHPE